MDTVGVGGKSTCACAASHGEKGGGGVLEGAWLRQGSPVMPEAVPDHCSSCGASRWVIAQQEPPCWAVRVGGVAHSREPTPLQAIAPCTPAPLHLQPQLIPSHFQRDGPGAQRCARCAFQPERVGLRPGPAPAGPRRGAESRDRGAGQAGAGGRAMEPGRAACAPPCRGPLRLPDWRAFDVGGRCVSVCVDSAWDPHAPARSMQCSKYSACCSGEYA